MSDDLFYRLEARFTELTPIGLVADGIRMHNRFAGRITAGELAVCGHVRHVWPPEMGAPIRERVTAQIPAERLQAYQSGTADSVGPDDLDVMAEAQVRYMVVGPDREPSDLEPEVWEKATQMCRDLFRRRWTGSRAEAGMLEPPAKGRLGEIAVPTLVVNGLADVPYIQHVSDLYADGISGAKRVDLPDTGHLPPLERPAEVSGLQSDFLESANIGRTDICHR